VVTLLLAVDEMTPTNGGMQVLHTRSNGCIVYAPSLWRVLSARSLACGVVYLQVIPGSHMYDLHKQQDLPGASVLGSGSDPSLVAASATPVDINLRPGDVSVHSPRILHGSPANTSDQRRYVIPVLLQLKPFWQVRHSDWPDDD